MKTQSRFDLRYVAPEDWTNYLNKGGTVSNALSLGADDLEALYTLAYQKYQGGNYQEALSLFQLLCTCNHYEAKYALALGATRQARGEYQLAGEIYSMAAILHPDDPRFAFHAAQCHLALGNWKAAGSGFEMALVCGVDTPANHALHEQASQYIRVLKNKLETSSPEKEKPA